MAASSQEKDYVHLVAAGIARETGRKPQLIVKNLYEFEHYYRTYDFSAIDDLVAAKPDFLVIALGENVKDLKTEEERLAFQTAFCKLLDRFTASGENARRRPRRILAQRGERHLHGKCSERSCHPIRQGGFRGRPRHEGDRALCPPGRSEPSWRPRHGGNSQCHT
jgi:hypothetical protein